MKSPKVRFRGYTDDWEERKLGDIADVTKLAGFEFTEHVVYSNEGNIIALRGLNIKNGELVLNDVKYIDSSNFSKLDRSKLYINDILFTYVGTVGEVAIIKENDRFYLAPNVSRIRIESDDLPEYISQYMRTEQFYKSVIFPLIATSSQPALSMESIRKFVIHLPNTIKEQNKISKYLGNLDRLIILHQQKCEKIKTLKKYMLQKMFPQNGMNVPEIRFNGFTDVWEQRKLEDIVEFLDTLRKPLEGTKRISGPYPYYGASGIVDYVEGYIFNEELVLLSEDGANIIDRNYPICFLASGKYWVNNHVHVLKVKLGNENNFVCNSLERKDYNQYNTGMAMPKLNQEVCRNIPIICPSYEEQKKIGDYFRNLDHLITLHQQKCDELQSIKKFMLQNMFV